MFSSFSAGLTIRWQMSFFNFKRKSVGDGENVVSPEAVPAVKHRRTGPAHGGQSSQREQLKKLLSNEEDSLKSHLQSNHPTAKDHPVSCSLAAM